MQTAESDMGILSLLIHDNDYPNAMTFLALGLPVQESVWWGYLAANEADADGTPNVQCALANIEEWVKEPAQAQTDFNAKCLPQLPEGSATYWCAKSVELGQQLIDNPPSKDTLNPEDISHALCVCNALKLYSKTRDDLPKHLIRQGLHIAMGGNGSV